MQIKTQFNALLNTKVTRKEFLKYIGLSVVVLSGASTLLKVFGDNLNGKNETNGYGNSAYGGSPTENVRGNNPVS